VANFRHEDYEFLIRLAWRTWKTLPLKGELVRKPLKIECLPEGGCTENRNRESRHF